LLHHQYHFQQYFPYHHTFKLSHHPKQITHTHSLQQFSPFIQQKIQPIQPKQNTLLTIPKNKSNIQPYIPLPLLLL
ncbi:type VII secretion protein EssB/YukC, partial [Bacillus altitudinis]|uniref:type VII secretion protein EssB/YukC n=1 Tax=Bacillus altitudinis TaxID=293387 RepID=UPI003B51D8FE